MGNPYRMTFAAVWFTAAGDPILELAAESSSWFNLAAASQTGSGKPTTATCSYPEGSNVLVCEYENSGHKSVVDGMVVPARQTATYTVSVVGDPDAWSIANANGGPYSARDLCPRGDGSDSGAGSEVRYCEHTIEMQQIAIVIPPMIPPVDPPPPPAVEPPAVEPAAAVLPAAATPPLAQKVLPATGGSVSVMLAIGVLMVAAGVMMFALTRRRVDPLALCIREAPRDTEAGLHA